MRTIVLASLIVLASPGYAATDSEWQNPKPSWIFQSGFEEGNKSIWSDYDGNPDTENQLILDPGPFGLTGNHVLRIAVPTGSSGPSDILKVLPATHDRLYARWYMKFETGFDLSVLNHAGGGLHAGDRNALGQAGTVPSNWFLGFVQAHTDQHPFVYTYYPGMYQQPTDHYADSFPFSYASTFPNKPQHRPVQTRPTLVTNHWYGIELMIDAGTPSTDGSIADGKMQLWVDNRLIGAWNDLWWRTDAAIKPYILWLSVFQHDPNHGTAGVLYDDVVVSTDRIGPYDLGGTPNHLPVLDDIATTTPLNTAKTVTLHATDADGNALTYEIITPPAHGTVGSVSGTAVTYTPNSGFTGVDTFMYRVFDGIGDGGPGTVSVNVGGSPANHAPVASNQSLTTAEDTAAAITLAASDADGNALTYAIVANPTHGTLSGSGATRTYTPTANVSGSDSFTFRANDGTADSNVATVSITVTAVNDAPVAAAQSVSAVQNTAKAITLSGSDVEGSALTYAVTANPSHGTLSGTGASRTYTPTTGYTGSDSFAFTVNDGALTSAAATVSITVTAPANAAPSVSAASATPSPVTATTTALSATASDDGGEANLTYTWSATGPAAVAFSPNGTNPAKASTATFTRAGSYTLTVTARDAAGLTGTRTVALTVAQTATALSVSPTSASVQPYKAVDFNAVFADQFGANLATQPTLSWSVSGSGGTMDANGLFTAGAGTTSPSGGVVATTYVVTASGGGQTATALVTVSTASTASAGGSSGGCGAGGAAGLIVGLGLMLRLRSRRR